MKQTTRDLIMQIARQDETARDIEIRALRLALAKPGCAVRANTMTVRDASRELNCTQRTIYNYIHSGKLNAITDARGQKRIPSDEVMSLV